MQVRETLAEGLNRGYEIIIPSERLAQSMNSKLDNIQRNYQMRGFRKGKAPVALLRKLFGESLQGEATNEIVDEAIRDHFEKSGDRPAAKPNVKLENEKPGEDEDLKLSLSYERLPDISEPDYKKISLQRLKVVIDDKEVDEALTRIASETPDFQERTKSAKAELNDQIMIDFVGSIGGKPFSGGDGTDFPLVLGSNSFIAGFEEQLVGAKQGERRQVKVTFPKNYTAKELAGKEAVFDCLVKGIKQPKPGKIDDELAKKHGAASLDELRKQIGTRFTDEYNYRSRLLLKRGLLDALDKLVTFDLPESIVSQEAIQVARELAAEEARKTGASPADSTSPTKKDATPTEEELKLARRRVRLGLLLSDIGAKAKIEVPAHELHAAVQRQAAQFPGQEKQYTDYIYKNEQALSQIRAPLFEDKVVDYMLELADVKEKSVSAKELQEAVSALDEEDTETSKSKSKKGARAKAAKSANTSKSKQKGK